MLFDSHCHLNHRPLIDNLSQVLLQASDKDIGHFLVPATSSADWLITIELAKNYPQIYAAVGLHPWFINYITHSTLQQLEKILLQHPQIIMGEIGLDFARAHSLEEKKPAN